MKFKANTRRRAIEYEKALVQYWKDNKTFEKSVEQRPIDNSYVFYDGPPFITGVPHHGTLLSSIVKDAVPRYWAMRGKHIERVWGWDSHGLPAENFVEKKLGITDRREIGTTITLEHYITEARDAMVANSATWEGVIDRVGRWVDFQGAYKTMDKNYMESVWWAFKTLYEKGKIYEGYKVLMYDTKFATPVSKNEVTMDNDAYQTVTDPSVYVKFKLNDVPKKSIELKKDAKVLFVCYSNAGRSHFAQGFYNHLTGNQNGESAGVRMDEKGLWQEAPDLAALEKILSETNPGGISTVATMAEVGVDVSAHKRQQLTEAMLDKYDLIVNIAEKSQTPDWFRGDNVVWWDVTDPHGESWEKNRQARGEIEMRVKKLVAGEVVDDTNNTFLLAWTTTPWTLPANTALAVNPAMEYILVEHDGEKLIVAKDLAPKVFTDEKHQPLEYTVLEELKGQELVGLSYQPLFDNADFVAAHTIVLNDGDAKANVVLAAEYVSNESGTGIVHLAPAYGEEDFVLAKAENLRVVEALDENGIYYDEVPFYAGLEVWENNKFIAKDLKEKGIVWKIDYIQHEYPFNPRSKQRIMYRAVPSWFFDVEGQKELMLEQNEAGITWFPEHIKNGRFAKNIEQAPDWNLSRDRFWATGLPVWKSEDGDIKVVGSYAELKELSGVELDDYHRPWVDGIEFDFEGKHYKRIEKVLDGWFESGSMPFAQFHYPFENKEKFEADFPGDFISEYVAQTRAWFYYLHVVNVGLFGKAPFKNAIVTGTVAGNDGRKMSKSLGNFTDPNELMDKYSADSLRFLLLSSPLLNGEDFSLQDKEVGDVARKLSMIWNMYDFFTMYADVDGWEWTSELEYNLDSAQNPLDKWVVSRLHQLQAHIETHMDGYNIPGALEEVLPFIDDASNWYVRRSRRRFWRIKNSAAGADDDADKNDAYKTLHYVLVRLSMILAPFVPFLAEELYQKLTGGESVHLLDWPKAGAVDEATITSMSEARKIIEQGLSLRMFKSETEPQVKVRQPLGKLDYTGQQLDAYYETIIAEEVNVKQVNYAGAEGVELVVLNKTITPELKREGLMREVVRQVQSARKAAGLNVDDRIALSLTTDDEELRQSIIEFVQVIKDETLVTSLEIGEYDYMVDVTIEGTPLKISLQKA